MNPDVVITSFGGLAPEQWWGSVAGHSFYFRERQECWRIELDLRPTGHMATTMSGETRDIESGDVIAEGVADLSGYGTTHVERAEFIVRTIREFLLRRDCTPIE